MYININPVSCQNYEYNVELNYSIDAGSDLLFAGLEINYGDGEINNFDPYENQYTLINDEQRLYKVNFKHSYSGPGKFRLSARYYNRWAEIINMEFSLNTPLYVETLITIDPFIGCNHTPDMENVPFLRNKSDQKYFTDFSFFDEENDSLSFHFTTAMQDRTIPAVNYWIPEEINDITGRKISRISMDPSNASVLWNTNAVEGAYTTVITVAEWRKVDGVYYQISSSIMDYTVDFDATENTTPVINGLQDAAIIIGQNYSASISAYDPDGDSIQVNAYGDFLRLMDEEPKEDFNFYPGPIEKDLNFSPTIANVRAKPYKAVYAVTDKNVKLSSLNQTKSMYIWITDREHNPEPPRNFMGQALSTALVSVYWNDSNDELGYILERADLLFPEFERIAVLPANTTSFKDSSVVENSTYQYRITAVGTTMSASQVVEVSTPDIVTALIDDFPHDHFRAYPNPNNGSFWISNESGTFEMEIRDLSGKQMWVKTIENPSAFKTENRVETGLSSGIYILTTRSGNVAKSQKIMID